MREGGRKVSRMVKVRKKQLILFIETNIFYYA